MKRIPQDIFNNVGAWSRPYAAAGIDVLTEDAGQGWKEMDKTNHGIASGQLSGNALERLLCGDCMAWAKGGISKSGIRYGRCGKLGVRTERCDWCRFD